LFKTIANGGISNGKGYDVTQVELAIILLNGNLSRDISWIVAEVKVIVKEDQSTHKLAVYGCGHKIDICI